MSFGFLRNKTGIFAAGWLALSTAATAFAAPLLETATDYLAESLDAANTTTTTPAPSPSNSPLSVPEIVGITLGIAAIVGIITYGLKNARILDLFCCEGDNIPDAPDERQRLIGD